MDFIQDDLKFIPPSQTCPRRPKNMPRNKKFLSKVTYNQAINHLKNIWLDKETFEKHLTYKSFKTKSKKYYLCIDLNYVFYYYIIVNKKIYDKLKNDKEGIKKYFENYNKKIEAMGESIDRLDVIKEEEGDNLGFQTQEGKERNKPDFTDKNIVEYVEENKVVFEVGGYCCMWSFFIMDLRLKFKDKEPQQIFSDIFDKIYNKYDKEGNNPFVTFIRSFTFNIMTQMDNMFNGTFQTLKQISTDENDRIVLMVNGKRKVLSEKESEKYEDKLDQEIRDKVKKFLDLSYSEKLKRLLDNSGGIKTI